MYTDIYESHDSALLSAVQAPRGTCLERTINGMGTTFSAPCDEKRTLPAELVINILSYLSVNDLVSCRLLYRELNDIINGSQHLQHQIDTAVAGVVDNPRSTLSLVARRRALARRQVAWDTCQPQNTVSESLKVPYRNIVPNNDRNESLLICNLREKGVYKVSSFAVCDDNNLIAMGSLKSLIDTTASGPNQSHLDSFEVDLLSISRGGGYHPAARKSTLHIKNILRNHRNETRMVIHTNLLAVHFMVVSGTGLGGLFPSELWVLDWKTGEKLAFWKGKGFSGFQFLSHSVMAIGSEMPPTAVLELFTIPVLTCNADPVPMTKILSLGLPSVDDGCRVAGFDFYHPSTIENVFIRDNCLFSYTTTDTKPFISTSSDDIIFASLNIGTRGGNYDYISFVVHSSALLRLIPFPPHGNMQDTILWESWGPTVTRWHEDVVRRLSPFASGQRCILEPGFRPGMGMGRWELWDFNPYRVRRLGKNFTLESEKASLSVETEPSCAKSRGIREGVYSSLPFVKIIPKQWSNYFDMGVYDDQICGRRRFDGKSAIDFLYFG